MLAGEPYQAWDKELYAARIECRKVLQKLNSSIPDTPEWEAATQELIPGCENAHLEPPFRCDYGSNIKLGKNFYATWYEAPKDPVHIHELTHQLFKNR